MCDILTILLLNKNTDNQSEIGGFSGRQWIIFRVGLNQLESYHNKNYENE